MQYNKINIRYKLTDFYAFRNQKRFLNVVFLRVCIDNDVWKHMTKIIIHSQFSCMSGVYVDAEVPKLLLLRSYFYTAQ